MSVVGCLNASWKIKLLIANSESWQALLNSVDPTFDPMVHTILDEVEEESVPFPRCIVKDTSDGGSIDFTRNELGSLYRMANVIATFEIQIPASANADTREKRSIWFRNEMGKIIEDIRQMAIPAGQLIGGEKPVNITAMGIPEGPAQVSYEELDYFDTLPSGTNQNLPLWAMDLQFTTGP